MKTKFYAKWSVVLIILGLVTTNLFGQPVVPTLTGPLDQAGLPATLGDGITTGQVYMTDPGQSGYQWKLSPAGQITAGDNTEQITVTWTDPAGQQTVSVSYDGSSTAVLLINYYPFLPELDPATIPQFVDPLPHFAGGLRVDAKAGGNLTIKAELTRQIAVSTGTVLATGTVDGKSDVGKGNYAGYAIKKEGGDFGPTMWPAQTIETSVGKELKVHYLNMLDGVHYKNFNILVDQTLLQNGYPVNGDVRIDPYDGPIPMVVHLHGGEMPSNSDGGPTAWFMPNNGLTGPGYDKNASSVSTYPNKQEAGTLWYHPHDQGNTRTNVYTGLAGFYFLRGPDEENAHLPGWSGDDKVLEVAPAGANAPFYPTTPYLPEIEIAIQDRMFNVNGELYWPVNPTNPDIHPFWTPEFFGDVMTVNGKTWPYLSVAPRKYRFRMLDGCNARFLNMWLEANNGTPAPVINVIGSDGAIMDSPKLLDFANGDHLFMAPGERYDVVIDFSNVPAGTEFILKNNANAPYPDGDPVNPGFTDQIMKFVVNGKLVSASDPNQTGHDNSALPGTLRSNPMVKLTDFAGKITNGVKIDKKREIILNEVATDAGPVQVLFNNSHFDGVSPIPGAPPDFGGPTEIPLEGTTEMISIINTTVDAHPIHVHLTQWQLVSRQPFERDAYMAAYSAAWGPRNLPEWPTGLGYPGGSGSPYPYDELNGDKAVGGNPAVNDFLIKGTERYANPEEQTWKDDVKSFPGEVATFMVRYAPTDRPINATPQQLLYPFDPSLGPGYVWHCHIIDHEDMDMMRPLMILPSLLRYPQITTQPAAVVACAGDIVTFSVAATSTTDITYQWEKSTDAGTTWTPLTNSSPYSGVLTANLKVDPTVTTLSTTQYRVSLTNIDGTTISNEVALTVNNCSIAGTLKYNNADLDPLVNFTVSVNGLNAKTDGSGAFIINNVTSGNFPVIITSAINAGGINSTDAGSAHGWVDGPYIIPNVRFLSGDVTNDTKINSSDVTAIEDNWVTGKAFAKAPWVYWNATGSGMVNPPAFNVAVNGVSVTGFDILGMSTGDFNSSFLTTSQENVSLSSSGYVVTYPAGKQFDLPIVATSSMQVGAVSLVLNVPSNLVTVKGVKVPGSNGSETFSVTGNVLRVGWNSTAPVNIASNGSLLVISLMPTTSFSSSTTMNITMVSDPLNELADGLFNPFSASLKIDAVKLNAVGKAGTLGLSASPNPMKGTTTVTYSLPEDGIMKLELFNSMSSLVQTVIPSMFQTAGTYTQQLSINGIRATYYLKLTLTTASGDLVKTITVVKK